MILRVSQVHASLERPRNCLLPASPCSYERLPGGVEGPLDPRRKKSKLRVRAEPATAVCLALCKGWCVSISDLRVEATKQSPFQIYHPDLQCVCVPLVFYSPHTLPAITSILMAWIILSVGVEMFAL